MVTQFFSFFHFYILTSMIAVLWTLTEEGSSLAPNIFYTNVLL